MQILIRMFFALFGEVIVSLGWKLLRGLGFAAVSYVGINALMDAGKEYVFTQYGSMPAQWVQLLGLLKLDVCINIIFSAYVARAVLWGVDRATGSKTSISYKGH